MSSLRCTPEFKEEAVREVVDRGHSVADVAQRIGVSAHSLYNWIKAVSPERVSNCRKNLIKHKAKYLS